MPPLRAWAVHAFTATGVVMAWLALLAVWRHDYRTAFLWMIAATAVDSLDGWLARLARVGEVLPHFNGARLDDIVDYLTFVFVPVALMHDAALFPASLAFPTSAAVLMASAYGFSSDDAKTNDYFFTGFPSYWNVVALYLLVLGLPAWANALVVWGLVGAVFVRTGYIYPSRTPILQTPTLLLGLGWAVLMGLVVWRLPADSPTLVRLSLVYPLYYFGLSVVLHRRRVDG
jgi:phosphatidylcholine synthase